MGNPFPGTHAQSFHFRWWLWVCALDTGASYSGERVHQTSIQNKTASFQKEAMRTQVALYFFYEVKFV